jgi:hypothetical protein
LVCYFYFGFIARAKPERDLEQLRHGRQIALAGEVEIAAEPSLGMKKFSIGTPRHPSAHSIVAVFL